MVHSQKYSVVFYGHSGSRMTTRRKFIVGGTIVASALAATKLDAAYAAEEAPKMGEFLFVQSAQGMTVDKISNKLTLTGVSPVTVFFTDRPERIAGNMKTASFIQFWSEEKHNFKSDPPNADVSLLDGKTLRQIIVELQDPVLNGDDLSYTVKVLQGDVPTRGDDVSVFIDIIGRPLNPLLFCGRSAAQLAAGILVSLTRL